MSNMNRVSLITLDAVAEPWTEVFLSAHCELAKVPMAPRRLSQEKHFSRTQPNRTIWSTLFLAGIVDFQERLTATKG